MSQLSAQSRVVNTTGVTSKIDTVELFFLREKIKTPGISSIGRTIEAVQGKRPIIERCKDRSGWLRGYRVAVHQSTVEARKLLDALQQRYHAVMCRFDVAYDFPNIPRDWFKPRLVMKCRRPGEMLEEPNGVYFIKQIGRRSRSGRDVLLYVRPSRRPGSRVELRFQNAGAVRRQGINRATDLDNLNPRQLFEKNFKLVEDIDAIKNAMIRKSLRAERKHHQRRHNGKHHLFVDQYRASLAYRLECQLNRLNSWTCPAPEGLGSRPPNQIKMHPDRRFGPVRSPCFPYQTHMYPTF